MCIRYVKKCKRILCLCLGPISKISQYAQAKISQPEKKISRILKTFVLKLSSEGGSALSALSSKSEAAPWTVLGAGYIETMKTEEEFPTQLRQFGRVWDFRVMTNWHMNEWLPNPFCLRYACELTMVSSHQLFFLNPISQGRWAKRRLSTVSPTHCTGSLISPFPRTTLGSKDYCCKVAHSERHSETTISSFQRVWLISILLVKQSIPYEITEILSQRS